MAESLTDAVFRLPSQFFTDSDVLLDKENAPVQENVLKTNLKPALSFPTDFPYEFDSLDSALSSPVESVLSSTETENASDEEDFLVGLTRRMTHSSAQKLGVPAGFTPDKLESWVVAGSPESTLSRIGSWSVSSSGSPNSSSLVCSPPTTPFGGLNNTWDLVSAAAGQVARLKMSNSAESVKYNNNSHARGLVAPPSSSSAVHVIRNPNSGLYAGQSMNFDVAYTNPYQQYLKQDVILRTQCGGSVRGRQQVMKPTWSSQPQQVHSKATNFAYEMGRCGRSLGQPAQSACPPLQVQHQHQQKPQQRPVTFGGSGGVKRECAGTGVFLPRRYGNNPPESRRRSVPPTRVVHAIKLNFDDVNGHVLHHQRFNTAFGANDDALIARRNALLTLQLRNLKLDGTRNHEIYLPQEWTY